MDERRVRPGRRCLATLLLMAALSAAVVAAAARPGRAQETGALYQATTIVTGTDMRSRPKGFAARLREVLAKVSGEPRLAEDPRVAALTAHADALVASFTYVDQMAGIKVHDDQGTYDRSYNLTVRFDPARIDQALADLGEQPWRGERPVMVPVIRVHGFKPAFLLDAESPAGADQRAALANAAEEYGMRLAVPTAAELAAWGVSPDGFPWPEARLPAERAVVAGRLEFREELPG
jgi:uncharacterized protein